MNIIQEKYKVLVVDLGAEILKADNVIFHIWAEGEGSLVSQGRARKEMPTGVLPFMVVLLKIREIN